MQEPLKPLSYTTSDDLELHRALMNAANTYLARRGDHRFANAAFIGKLLLLTLLCLIFYVLSLCQTSFWGFAGAYGAFIFIAMSLAVNVIHDASHNVVFRRQWANRLLNIVVSIPLGMDPDCWRVRHILFHHAHVNVQHYDLDIEENGVLRQSPFHRFRFFMRAQRFYWPLVAALTFPCIIWFFDWRDRAGKTPVTPKMAAQGAAGWLIFLLSKALHALLALALPWLLLTPAPLSAGALLLVYLASQMLASLIFVVLILGSHWAKATFYQPPEDGIIRHGRYQHTFATTVDWHTRPVWLGYWLGQLNLHLTHHLFPNWNHRHYPALAQIIAEVAPRYGAQYQCVTLAQILRTQQRFLQKMGEGPPDGESGPEPTRAHADRRDGQ
ncbi:acyl-CoA desaturase [Affinibrenneria salicis]|uniref:Acyl-CoA desaturase n=1 Tax=Affinibrenneria salicis TaxID=2590031 RepID=A0A5J5G0W0_9GAMM|nr:acyl-CoA desaturase [Affinibrenneria salicis]KAA9000115.1 acyl-CoA desaturase [Affinibrenneria salicis]